MVIHRAAPRLRAVVLMVALMLGLSSCGFQLRGSTNIPFKTVYLGYPETSPITVAIRRSIRGNGPTKIVTNPAEAEIGIYILSEYTQFEILTITNLGFAAEYNIYFHLRFAVRDGKGKTYIAPTELTLKRLLLANNNAVLAENYQMAQLIADMQQDAAQQILRRIEAIKPDAPDQGDAG